MVCVRVRCGVREKDWNEAILTKTSDDCGKLGKVYKTQRERRRGRQ